MEQPAAPICHHQTSISPRPRQVGQWCNQKQLSGTGSTSASCPSTAVCSRLQNIEKLLQSKILQQQLFALCCSFNWCFHLSLSEFQQTDDEFSN